MRQHRISDLRLFFFNDTATTEIYTLSLHDALPIFLNRPLWFYLPGGAPRACRSAPASSSHTQGSSPTNHASCPGGITDRKSTRLNSSHANISYAVFCLKKKK